eukprot:6454775-Amphidinium_carterae.1
MATRTTTSNMGTRLHREPQSRKCCASRCLHTGSLVQPAGSHTCQPLRVILTIELPHAGKVLTEFHGGFVRDNKKRTGQFILEVTKQACACAKLRVARNALRASRPKRKWWYQPVLAHLVCG